MTWTRGPIIGRGSTAVVSLAATSGGEIFAVKSADLSSSSSLQREEKLLSQLSSPYIIKCLGSDTTRENNRDVYNLFLEYLSGGTLSDQIRKHGGSLDEHDIRINAHRLLLGLSYLHANGLIHCDIKGQNVLIAEDGALKIADFGCAKRAEESIGGEFSGTPAYMSPEVARGEEQGFAADVWAFGCTVIEMATGKNPWPEVRDAAAAVYRIGFSGDVPEVPDWLSDEAKDMIAACLIKDPRERWTVNKLLEHPFFGCVDESAEFTRKSPTSVISRGFWDDLEASDSDISRDSSEVCLDLDLDSDSDSPVDRVMVLVGDGFSERVDFSGWGDEDDWLTVRGDVSEEIVDEDEEIGSSVSVDDFVMDCYNGDISESSVFPVSCIDSVNEDIISVFRIVNFGNCGNGIISSLRTSFVSSFLAFS